ncbi:MazG-like family protein [Streptomyces sp. NPDC058374]|uniref:MazG-like family protein n=1 Tax=unclassified Streptomyces TaxID=2593676 RepID=UPI0036593525
MDAHDTDTPLPAARPSPAVAGPAEPWDAVEVLYAWLEQHNRQPPGEALLLRMLKLAEETGEVAQAVIGAIGQNPRKGVSHDWDDVRAELCDVIVTAMVALRTLSPDARTVLAAHLARTAARTGTRPPDAPTGTPPPPPTAGK